MGKAHILLALSIVSLISGCAQKVMVKSLEPAEISGASHTKKVAVTPFINDSVNLSDKIEASISNQKIDDNPFFTVVNRSDLNKIIAEQRIQSSGLLSEKTAVKVGNLLGVQAIISGSVNNPTSHDDYYSEGRTKCKGKDNCYDYTVSCQKRTVGLSAQVRMINVSTGGIIYANNLSREESWHHCSDSSGGLPSKEAAAGTFSKSIADDFAHRLTPHYRYVAVTLLEKPDLKYSNEQEKLLENSLLYIKQSRDDKAEALLRKLMETTNSQSYVPFYNLGVIYESRGLFNEAQEYYNQSDKLTVEPIEAISEAVVRIKGIIEKQKIALQQIAKK